MNGRAAPDYCVGVGSVSGGVGGGGEARHSGQASCFAPGLKRGKEGRRTVREVSGASPAFSFCGQFCRRYKKDAPVSLDNSDPEVFNFLPVVG